MGQKQAGRRRRARRMDPVQALSEDTGPRWGRGGFLPAPPSVVDSTGPGRPAHAPGLPCTRASLGRGENGAETRAGPGGPALCARSCVCPEQCLILLPLASVCLDSTKRRPWGGDLALWRRQRWYTICFRTSYLSPLCAHPGDRMEPLWRVTLSPSFFLPGCSLFTCIQHAFRLDCSPLCPGHPSGKCPSSTWRTASKRGGRICCC